jgi:hypothetical protein
MKTTALIGVELFLSDSMVCKREVVILFRISNFLPSTCQRCQYEGQHLMTSALQI